MIEIKNLCKTYNPHGSNRVKGLDGVSVSLEKNGFYVIYGKSGAGKSTFMNTVGGLDRFDGGSIRFGNEEFTKTVSDRFRTEHIGYIFQNYCLDEQSNVYENVAMGLRSIGITDEELIFERTMTALANVGMQNCFKRKVTALSGGQQQRVAIARVMAKGCKIILADEPTGNLDEDNSKQVLSFLKEMSATRIIIVVTHETEIVKGYADQVIEISDGTVKSVGQGGGAGVSFGEKQNLYLDEFSRTVTQSDGITLERYGDAVPLRLQIINDGGKLYLSVGQQDVQVIGKGSEIQLIEKSREEFLREKQEHVRQKVRELAPLPAGKIGSVFTFQNSFETRKEARSHSRRRDRFLKFIVVFLMIGIIFQSGYWGEMFHRYRHPAETRMGAVICEQSYLQNVSALDRVLEQNSEKLVRVGDYRGSWRGGDWRNFCMVQLGNAPFESDVKGNVSAEFLQSWILPYEQAAERQLLFGKRGGEKNCLLSEGIVRDWMDSLRRNSQFGFNLSFEEFVGQIIGLQCIPVWRVPYVITGVVRDDTACVYLDSFETLRGNLIMSDISVLSDGVEDDVLYLTENIENTSVDVELADGSTKTLAVDNSQDMVAVSEKTARECGSGLVLAVPIQNSFYRDIYVKNERDVPELLQKLREAVGDDSIYITSSTEDNERRQQWLREDMNVASLQIAVNYVLLLVVLAIVIFSDYAAIGKTVGVYRAIGVSKKNILFRCLCSNLRRFLMLAFGIFLIVGGLTVLNTYLHIFASLKIIGMVFGINEMYLAWWQWLAIGVTVLPLSALISLLPVIRHLNKTPAKLLGQHDV